MYLYATYLNKITLCITEYIKSKTKDNQMEYGYK